MFLQGFQPTASLRKNSVIARVTRKPRKKRIVILGGGFGGVYAAINLQKLLAADRVAEICLVSHDNFFLFTPMLHEIAASDLEITNIVNPLRKLLHKVEVLVGDVDQIDLAAKRVLISHNSRNYPQQIGYDHLVIALGSVTNFYNLAGCHRVGPADEIAFGRNSIARTNPAPFGGGELRMFARRSTVITYFCRGRGWFRRCRNGCRVK
jgi:NADPH-dependent 2,4-dienoyl-CoA reductase/sulfur reductase-like enzyme